VSSPTGSLKLRLPWPPPKNPEKSVQLYGSITNILISLKEMRRGNEDGEESWRQEQELLHRGRRKDLRINRIQVSPILYVGVSANELNHTLGDPRCVFDIEPASLDPMFLLEDQLALLGAQVACNQLWAGGRSMPFPEISNH